MFLKQLSIRQKLLISFFGISLITMILALVAYFQIKALDTLNNFSSNLYKLNAKFSSLIEADLELFGRDIFDTSLYQNQSSPRVLLHQQLMNEIKSTGKENAYVKKLNSDYLTSISKLDSGLSLYDSAYQALLSAHLTVGFKDFGLTGKMRNHAHTLEETENKLKLEDLLTLRRHEKDYLLRRESQYLLKFEKKKNAILYNLKEDKDKDIIEELNLYSQTLFQIAEIHNIIGDYNANGLRYRLKSKSDQITQNLISLNDLVVKEHSRIVSQIYFLFALSAFILLFLSIGLGAWLSHRFADPLERLSNLMDKMTIKQFDSKELSPELEQGDEIRKLSQSFIRLIVKLRNQLNQLEHTSQKLKVQNKELKALNSELDHFVYRAAHDLRAPLTTLLGLVDITRRDFHAGNKDSNFEMMEDTIRKLDRFISDIVDYARNRREEQVYQTVDIGQTLQNAIDHYNFLPQKNRFEIIIEQRTSEIPIITDKIRLQIILSSLISNAFRFYDPEKKQPQLIIKVNADTASFEISIYDNGIGIEDEHLSKVLEIFYRGSLRSKGSGLGLFIANETVQNLQGKLSIHSVAGEYTEVFLKLPNQTKAKDQTRKNQKESLSESTLQAF